MILLKIKINNLEQYPQKFYTKKKNIQLINIYVPNGNPVDTDKYSYKKKWLNDLIKQLKSSIKKNPIPDQTFSINAQTLYFDYIQTKIISSKHDKTFSGET